MTVRLSRAALFALGAGSFTAAGAAVAVNLAACNTADIYGGPPPAVGSSEAGAPRTPHSDSPKTDTTKPATDAQNDLTVSQAYGAPPPRDPTPTTTALPATPDAGATRKSPVPGPPTPVKPEPVNPSPPVPAYGAPPPFKR